MPEPLLPLFPLELVLLPGASVPLHIFEDRYKGMIGEAIRGKTEFGIVQAGEKGILNVGCSATVADVVNRYPDGRLDIVTKGHRRFEIILLDQEKSYLRAAVSFFDDEAEDAPPLQVRAMTLAAFQLLVETGQVEDEELDQMDPQLSFRIAKHLPDLQFRQTLLGMRSETERLRRLYEFLPDYIAQMRRAAHIKKVALKNGHGFTSIGRKEQE